MKKLLALLILLGIFVILSGCNHSDASAQIVTSILPIYDITSALCENTNISVTQLVTEEVSCLHDYTLQVRQMRLLSSAELIVISGAGFETFLEDVLPENSQIVDASAGIPLLSTPCEHEHNHDHKSDPHIWLSPKNVNNMSKNICNALCQQYPQYSEVFKANLTVYQNKLDALQSYATESLKDISNRKLITFHDGFSYLAESFDLEIIHVIEEESGSEASASEIINIANLIKEHALPAIFTERNGSNSAANIIAKEIDISVYSLDMAVTGNNYFDAMYHNIDTLKEALQ